MEAFRTNLERAAGRDDAIADRSNSDVSLAGPDVARLALEAELQNLGTTQFLTQAVTTAIKKDLIDEILRGSSQEPAPQTHPESSVAAPSDRTLNGHQSIAPISSRVS